MCLSRRTTFCWSREQRLPVQKEQYCLALEQYLLFLEKLGPLVPDAQGFVSEKCGHVKRFAIRVGELTLWEIQSLPFYYGL